MKVFIIFSKEELYFKVKLLYTMSKAKSEQYNGRQLASSCSF